MVIRKPATGETLPTSYKSDNIFYLVLSRLCPVEHGLQSQLYIRLLKSTFHSSPPLPYCVANVLIKFQKTNLYFQNVLAANCCYRTWWYPETLNTTALITFSTFSFSLATFFKPLPIQREEGDLCLRFYRTVMVHVSRAQEYITLNFKDHLFSFRSSTYWIYLTCCCNTGNSRLLLW